MACCTEYNGRVVSRIGAALVVLGFLSMVFGIAGVAAFWRYSFFHVIGAPIWSGVMVSGNLRFAKAFRRKGPLGLDGCSSINWCRCEGSRAIHAVTLLLGLAECAMCLTSSILCCVGFSTVPQTTGTILQHPPPGGAPVQLVTADEQDCFWFGPTQATMSCCTEYNGRVVSRIGAVLVVLSFLSVVFGIVDVTTFRRVGVTAIGAPIWSGVMMVAFLTLSIISVMTSVIQWIISAVGIAGPCSLCTAIHTVNLLLGLAECAMCLTSSIMSCVGISTVPQTTGTILQHPPPGGAPVQLVTADEQVMHLVLRSEQTTGGTENTAMGTGSTTEINVTTLADAEIGAGLQLDGAHQGRERTAAASNRQVTGGETEETAVGTGLDATEINVTTLADVVDNRAGLQLDGAHRGRERAAPASNRQVTGGETEPAAVGTGLDATEINVTTSADVVDNRAGLQLDGAHRGRERTAPASNKQVTGEGTDDEPGYVIPLRIMGASSRVLAWKNISLSSKLLGAGHFGEVRKGTVTIDGNRIQSAIKVLKRGADEESKEEFRQEVDIMRHVSFHPNIINLLGVCNHDGQQYMALELATNGDLLKYLRKSRVHMTSPYDDMRPEVHTASNLSPVMLLRIACDVASGMEHLAAKDVIHRDLAARNVLLTDSLIAKVADFGLSRGEGIYVQKSGKAVPFRSTAIEALNTRTYTTESDVWSFGILLWEIVTLGGTPYSGMKSRLLLRRLHEGYRLPRPRNCEDALYHMMKSCWELLPTDRPTFSDLVKELTGMMADMTTYINIDDDYEYEVVDSGDEDDDDDDDDDDDFTM
ncbi:TIE1 [Branchiostoma lanceolatum]|uniref:TIE1 protein n=1 Tax=Branchiostoma lanceolatum TaxID=7740 RepID=A0A8J9ZF26_BRALA|nr:TIE1 [Branchiostoma lanceolatum]